MINNRLGFRAEVFVDDDEEPCDRRLPPSSGVERHQETPIAKAGPAGPARRLRYDLTSLVASLAQGEEQLGTTAESPYMAAGFGAQC